MSKHHCQGNQRIQGALETDEEIKPKQPAPRQTLGKRTFVPSEAGMSWGFVIQAAKYSEERKSQTW